MRHLKSLRTKFIRTMLIVSGIVGLSTLLIVIYTNTQASSQHLVAVQKYIEQGISSKGKVLTENHALALRGLTLDNAFLDMQRLVQRAVSEDSDVVYGLYVNSERQALAYTRVGAAPSAETAPSPEAWRELGFDEAHVLVQRPEIKRTRRLGQDLLEVAVPVIGEESEVLGTIRYGLSTRRMHDALAQAETAESARLSRSLWLLGSLVFVSSLLGLLLSRVQAVRITRPVDDLTAAAEKLASGDRSVRVDVRSGDEIERLGASFNHMVEDLDRSYGELEEMNRTLEQKVAQRTEELASKNRDMRLVLDNVDQGFITLGPDGSMSLEHSAVVDAWFGEFGKTQSFAEYISKTSRAFGLEFQLGWDQVVEDVLPVEVALSQLPERLSASGRTWSFRYLPFFKDGKLEGVLLVIADISERLAKEREEAEQSELMQGFKKLMLDRSGFSIFLREASEMVEAICTRALDNDMVVLKRTIHTLKGNSASMGLVVVARLCHTLEEQLAQSNATSDKTLAELFARWNAMTEHIAAFSGNASQRVIEIPEAEYASLVSRLSEDVALRPELLHQVLAWQLEPVARPFRRLSEQAKQLARRLEKGELRVEIESNNVRLDPDTWSPFFSELIHVVRNSVDHGIETEEERRAQNKPPNGTLVLKSSISNGTLNFEIGDDGRGIDWEAIAAKAKENNLPHETHADLLEALCADGVTTRNQVSTVSGRGVGMAAVRQRVRAMGGRMEVRSVRGVGTHWIIRFPWSHDIPSIKPARAESQAPSRSPISLAERRRS
ncbi:MAG: HAMP domain-containing protein [Myxococcota bacterium]